MCLFFVTDGTPKEFWNSDIGRYSFGMSILKNEFHLSFAGASISKMEQVVESVGWEIGGQIQSIDGCS